MLLYFVLCTHETHKISLKIDLKLKSCVFTDSAEQLICYFKKKINIYLPKYFLEN